MIVLRRELAARHPRLASDLVALFKSARELGKARLRNHGLFACGLPWLRQDLEELPEIFGGDWYAHGFPENRASLAVLAQAAVEQGFSRGTIDPAQLFAPGTTT